MGDLKTIKVKYDNELGHAIINHSDYDPDKHEPFDDESADAVKDWADSHEAVKAKEAVRISEANRGVTAGPNLFSGRNPSGTFSTPTPTDVRYPNKDETEFENNHGAFIGKSAAEMRATMGLPDAPGGINPKSTVEGSENDGLSGFHVGKGPRGKFYVKNGKARISEAYDTEDEAEKALKSVMDENAELDDEKAAKIGNAGGNADGKPVLSKAPEARTPPPDDPSHGGDAEWGNHQANPPMAPSDLRDTDGDIKPHA
jgi:hypothetical protein